MVKTTVFFFLALLGSSPIGAQATLLREGKQLLDQKKYPEAEQKFSQALATGYDSAEVYLRRGLARLKQKKFSDAGVDLETYRQRKGESSVALLYGLAVVRWEEKQTDAAFYFFRQAHAKGAAFEPVDLYRLGLMYAQRAYDNEAIELLTKAERTGTKTPELYEARGRANYRQKQYEKAVADLAPFLAAKPDDVVANECMGLSLARLQKRTEALPFLTRAAAQRSAQPEVYFYLGEQALANQQPARAIACFAKADSLGFQNTRFHTARGHAWFMMDSLAAALREFDKALKWDQTHGPALAARANVYFRQEKWARVITDVALAEALNAAQPADLERCAQAWAGLGDYPQAIAWLSKVLAKQNQAAYLVQRGQWWLRVNEKAKACSDFAAAQKLGMPVDEELKKICR
ncbi:MAG: tetratricopeptide repeat protein [Cyclobacteriaceae bacterium]|jgi:tetratricopeptide (TPR) repeat protein|nr:tetratricopeptide repeat protein [Cyclobacteriaceae bacterium]